MKSVPVRRQQLSILNLTSLIVFVIETFLGELFSILVWLDWGQEGNDGWTDGQEENK